MASARSPFAAAQDGLFFRRMGRVHPRFHSPSTALVVQGWMATLLLLLIGEFQQLFELAIFSEWLFYALTVSSVFVFRRRESPGAPTFRSPGFPVLPAIFVLAAAVLVYHSFADNLRNSLIGLAIILAGVPLFYLIRSRGGSPTIS
jgi:APA family basic amino acid/polyamine antiporter